MKKQPVIGVDFGIDSVRAVVVDTRTGESVETHVQPQRAGIVL